MKNRKEAGYKQLSPENTGFKRMDRSLSFRASLRRMSCRIGSRQTGEMGGGASHLRQVDEERYGPDASRARLPVVSLYAGREDMRFLRRKTSVRESKVRVIKHSPSSALSPNSRIRVDRLVRKLGPEAFEAAECGVRKSAAEVKKSAKAKEVDQENADSTKRDFPRKYRVRKSLEAIPLSDPPKRRKSLGNLLEGEETEESPIKSNVETNRGMEQGRVERQKKIPPIDIHLTALFAAVEHGHVDKAKTILESTDVDVNGVNSDGLSPLDIAVLSNNKTLIKMLIAFGAQEGNEFSSGESLLCHLRKLSCEADQRICELAGQDTRNQSLWQRRSKGLANMIMGFTQARPPDIPSLAAVDVTGSHMVNVRYQEPESPDSPPCTKYKIEWSQDDEFKSLCGYRIILDPKQQDCHIDELNHGQRYYFRVCCGNVKGWGHPRPSTPQSVVPSSWRDVVKRDDRMCAEGIAQLDKLFREVRTGRPDIKALQDAAVGERRKKTTIKQLFTAASKFQKHLRRGVYLSCLFYHEDKVLVTNEDFLPVIEVDETYPGSIYHDFHWLLKVSCTWDDVKWLRQDMEKSLSSPAIHFRIKLLQAAAQMQTALSVQDLGQLYHKPLRDTEGTIVISTVNYIRSPKSVSVLNSRWVPLGKLTKRTLNLATEAPLGDILMSSISDQITYHQVSSIRLPRGLYLGYLKMRSSVDLLQVLVPAKAPNVPPHCKIRDNPHITAEEWECLTSKNGSTDSLHPETEQQKTFVEQVAATINRLLTYMQVSEDQSQNHRLYDAEVVEVSNEVSLLIVVPPPEAACSAPGQGEILLQRPDLIPLPVQVFEMVHLGTYHKQLVARYSRLSCIIELDTALAQHSHREAFSSSEVSAAKERLSRLEALQTQLNAAWKQARWLLDVLAFARDKVSQTPTNIIRHLLALHPKRSHESITSHNGIDWGNLSLYCIKSQEEFDREASSVPATGKSMIQMLQRTMSIIHEEGNPCMRSFDDKETLGEINLGFSQDSVEDEYQTIPDYLEEQTKPIIDEHPYHRKYLRRNSLNPQLLNRSQSMKEPIEYKPKPPMRLTFKINPLKQDDKKNLRDEKDQENHVTQVIETQVEPCETKHLNVAEIEQDGVEKQNEKDTNKIKAENERICKTTYDDVRDSNVIENNRNKECENESKHDDIGESNINKYEKAVGSSLVIKDKTHFEETRDKVDHDSHENEKSLNNFQESVRRFATMSSNVSSKKLEPIQNKIKDKDNDKTFIQKNPRRDQKSLSTVKKLNNASSKASVSLENHNRETSFRKTENRKDNTKEKKIKPAEKSALGELKVKPQNKENPASSRQMSQAEKDQLRSSVKKICQKHMSLDQLEYKPRIKEELTVYKSKSVKNPSKTSIVNRKESHGTYFSQEREKSENSCRSSQQKSTLGKRKSQDGIEVSPCAVDIKEKKENVAKPTQLLLPPETKNVKSRGSWPGPGVTRLLCAATAELSRSEHQLSSAGSSTPPPVQRAQPPPIIQPVSPPAVLLEQPRLPPSKSEDTLALHTRVMAAHSRNRTSSSAATSPSLSVRQSYGSGSLYSLSSDDSGVNVSKSKSEGEEGTTVPAPSPGILQVYAAYETGLASGTSLKLHVSPRTTAREVVDLVVKQLNMAVVLKGKDGPIYPAEQLHNFCLVAVIGARERCLRDDFKPLQLQNPWKKGRLYVRQKHDVLAALEQSSRHSAYL